MSNPYPSRRELRLQRERDERAKLRDHEAQRWADEEEQRQQRATEAEKQANEALAKAEPVPASHATPVDEEPTALVEDAGGPGRRAASSPIDAPSESEVEPESLTPSRRRRADSKVTSTGMLPIITKRRDDDAPKPRSRREARQQAAQKAAERRADIEALEAQQATQSEAEPKVVRRATAPQAPPPPIPAETAPVESQEDAQEADHEEDIVVSTSEQYDESSMEITDMSGLDTMEIRRAELRAETEKLTQEIIALGQENPNVIDPLLLRRQKELAEKSQELQDLETAAIAITEEQDQRETSASTDDDPASLKQQRPLENESSDEAVQEVPAKSEAKAFSAEPDEVEASAEAEVEGHGKRARRARRANSGPVISGPFEVSGDNEATGTKVSDPKPDFASHFNTPPEAEAQQQTGPDQPLEASSAHGLDTLDPRETEAPERRLMTVSFAVFAIGIIALIAAIILFTR